MSMYNDYTFQVIAIDPSGLLQYQSGKASSSRSFLVQCQYAEEFALRVIGKFYQTVTEPETRTPILPAPFPFDSSYNNNRGQLNMVATGFSIEPYAKCCFNIEWLDEADDPQTTILDPTSFAQMEKYFYEARGEEEIDNSECLCKVTITYEENPCDCLQWSDINVAWTAHAEILPGTCISVERNPAYEMFTLPNAGLVWKNIYNDQSEQVGLKADSYAYKVIPKADIIVHWHNVPVKDLCRIETHLRQFRGKTNEFEWGASLNCDVVEQDVSSTLECTHYEPETILFIDFQEDRSKRTDAFGGNVGGVNMNTTTLKLVFKQKRVEIEFGASGSNASVSDDDTGIAGWNHLFTDEDFENVTWARVVVRSTQQPVFPLIDFSTILNPDL